MPLNTGYSRHSPVGVLSSKKEPNPRGIHHLVALGITFSNLVVLCLLVCHFLLLVPVNFISTSDLILTSALITAISNSMTYFK